MPIFGSNVNLPRNRFTQKWRTFREKSACRPVKGRFETNNVKRLSASLMLMCPFPTTRAIHVAEGKGAAKRMGPSPRRVHMVRTDSRALALRERIAQLIQYVNGTTSVSATVTTSRLAQIVEQCRDGNGVCREAVGMSQHVIVHFHGVLGEPAVALVMPVAVTREVVGCLKVVDNGVRPRTTDRAKDTDDSVFDLCHVPMVFHYYNTWKLRVSFNDLCLPVSNLTA